MDLTKTEAQVWLIVFHLLCNPDCRNKYEWNSYRKDIVLKSRKYLNAVLVDQLPVLTDVQRYMDELLIVKTPEPTSQKSLILEVVPDITESIYKNNDWVELSKYIKKNILTRENNINDEIKQMGDLYSEDYMADIIDKPICNKCGKDAIKKCGRCKSVYYCSRECQVEDWKTHKPICDLFVQKK